MPSLSSKYGLSYEYLVSEPITILFSDRVWNCSCWVVKGTPSWTLVDTGAFLILWVESIHGYLCKTWYVYDIDGAHRNTFLVVKDTEAFVPAFRSARFNTLGLVWWLFTIFPKVDFFTCRWIRAIFVLTFSPSGENVNTNMALIHRQVKKRNIPFYIKNDMGPNDSLTDGRESYDCDEKYYIKK